MNSFTTSINMFENASSTLTALVSTLTPSAAMLDRLQSISFEANSRAFDWILSMFTWSVLWKSFLVFMIAANFKNFPLIYHLRILNAVRFLLRSQRPKEPVNPTQLFQPLITSSRASLLETDVFGHKSNSTYFSDVDVARVHLMTTLFGTAIEKIRGSTTMNGLSGKPTSSFTIPLGGVSCTFRRELKPYQAYDMWTRILSWDDKWFYIVTHFVKQGAKIEPREYTLYPRQNSIPSSGNSSRQGSIVSLPDDAMKKDTRSPVCASALSKIVFKDGRTTIAPEVMLETAGLLPPKMSDADKTRMSKLAEAQLQANIEDVSPLEAVKELRKVGTTSPTIPSSRRGSLLPIDRELTREDIEAERLRGMKQASLLAKQSALENEYHDEVALGRHHDGYGVEGVVATLAQLGKLSSYQLL